MQTQGPGSSTWACDFTNELLRLSGDLDPVRSSHSHNDPLLHQPSVTRVEALALVATDEFVDSVLWELHDELTSAEHRENLSVHF